MAAIIESKLVRMIRDGLAQAGIETGKRRHGLIFIDSLDWPVAVRVAPYTFEVPVWRITFGRIENPRCPYFAEQRKLTPHISEFRQRTGIDLARLLREPGWRWPLFDHDQGYPSYAWSELARETYGAHRLKMQALEQRRNERLSRP